MIRNILLPALLFCCFGLFAQQSSSLRCFYDKTTYKYGFRERRPNGKDGKVIIAPQFDQYAIFYGGVAQVIVGGKYGYLDSTGSYILPCEYDKAYDFENGIGKVQKGDFYGIVDKTGKFIVPLEYQYISDYCKGKIMFCTKAESNKGDIFLADGTQIHGIESNSSKGLDTYPFFMVYNGGFGVVNEKGKLVLPMKYTNIEYVRGKNDYFVPVDAYRKRGLYDWEGNELIPVIYEKIGEIRQNHIMVFDGSKFGFYNISGKEVVPPKYDYAEDFAGNVALFRDNGKWGYLDSESYQPIAQDFDRAWSFSDFRGRVLKDGKYGFINRNGNPIIPIEYEDAYDVSNSVAWVKQNGKWGAMNDEGANVTPFCYEDIRSNIWYFLDFEKTCVKKDGKWGIINIENKIENAFKYDDLVHDTFALSYEGFDRVFYKLNNKWGILNNGKEITKPMYDKIVVNEVLWYEFGYPSYGIQTGNGHGLIIFKGNKPVEIVSPIYDSVSLNYHIYEVQGELAINLYQKGKIGIYNYEKNKTLKPEYDKIFFLEDPGEISSYGKYIAIKNGKYGFVDIFKGTEVAELKYDTLYLDYQLYETSYGAGYVVEIDGKKGVANCNGKEIIPVEYDEIQYNCPKCGEDSYFRCRKGDTWEYFYYYSLKKAAEPEEQE
ncbi:MAG: WG repeat-containing protein [Bacteroidetes bacterium]|nr:WG repeat-containing protein [Bacteroidota bacterium]MBU1720184.1 WG repeat-containing protein [Bacteroidota bacterium]